MKKIIAVDVDLTVVDSLTPWLAWFHAKVGAGPKNEELVYDLVPEMRKICAERGHHDFDPFSFWLDNRLYSSLKPLNNAVRVLTDLHNQGAEIIFASLCEPEHIRSKVGFLHQHFKFDFAFIDTAHKHFVNYDYLIDDREKHMELGLIHRPHATHILFSEVLRAGRRPPPPAPIKQAFSWDQVSKLIKEGN